MFFWFREEEGGKNPRDRSCRPLEALCVCLHSYFHVIQSSSTLVPDTSDTERSCTPVAETGAWSFTSTHSLLGGSFMVKGCRPERAIRRCPPEGALTLTVTSCAAFVPKSTLLYRMVASLLSRMVFHPSNLLSSLRNAMEAPGVMSL